MSKQIGESDKPIWWGILATGSQARHFTEDLISLDGHIVAAIGSRTVATAQAFANRYGIGRSHASYEALAADDDIDIVYIATPHSGHFAAARLCLQAGWAVLVEKLFAVTARQAEEIAALAAERRLLAMEAMWTRFNPVICQIIDLVTEEGILGRITSIQADFAIAPAYNPAHRLWNPDLAGSRLARRRNLPDRTWIDAARHAGGGPRCNHRGANWRGRERRHHHPLPRRGCWP